VIKAFLVMVFLRLNSVRSLARFLEKNTQLRLACGLEKKTPSYRTLTRRFKTLESSVIDFARQIIQILVKKRIISLKVITTDASLLEAKGRPYKKGSLKIKPSDSDASWGWSKTRDWVFGYKLHLTSTVFFKDKTQTLVPLIFEVSSANPS